VSISTDDDTDSARSDGEYDSGLHPDVDMPMEDNVDPLGRIGVDSDVDMEWDGDDEQEEDEEEEDEKKEDEEEQ